MIRSTPLARLFRDKTEAAIFLTSFLVEIAFGLYLVQRWGFTFESGDSISHLYIASTVVNNGAQNNLGNLGTVWLPLFHILVMPLVLIEPLYTTGFAGTIVNAFMTGGICVVLYRLMGGGRLGVFSPALFMGNAWTLFFGATPMMEQTAIFFMVLAAYYFKRYWEKDDLLAFMKCSLALFFGTLTRYEVWVVALLVASFFLAKELKGRRFHRIAYIHFLFWGVFVWLFWNLAIFRDPLMFLHHPGGPGNQALRLGRAFVGNPLLTIHLAFEALYTISGVICLVSLTVLIMGISKRRWNDVLPSLMLVSPLAFHVYACYAGTSGGWFRHFYLSLPGFIMLSGLLVKKFELKRSRSTFTRSAMLAIVVTIVLYATAIPTQMNMLTTGYCLGEGEKGDPVLPQIRESTDEFRQLKKLLDDAEGPILATGVSLSYQNLVVLGISPSQIIDEYDGDLFVKVMREPWEYCSLVVILKVGEIRGESTVAMYNDLYNGTYFVYQYYNNDAWRSKFLKHYEFLLCLEFSQETLNIFKLVVPEENQP